MYLLIRSENAGSFYKQVHLHSIMYLLIRPSILFFQIFVPLFTFHNVSINSHLSVYYFKLFNVFTFHNVSINSQSFNVIQAEHNHLHSIMYLLIRVFTLHRHNSAEFTFHNVSINSLCECYGSCCIFKFTFHNVSINSLSR